MMCVVCVCVCVRVRVQLKEMRCSTHVCVCLPPERVRQEDNGHALALRTQRSPIQQGEHIINISYANAKCIELTVERVRVGDAINALRRARTQVRNSFNEFSTMLNHRAASGSRPAARTNNTQHYFASTAFRDIKFLGNARAARCDCIIIFRTSLALNYVRPFCVFFYKPKHSRQPAAGDLSLQRHAIFY